MQNRQKGASLIVALILLTIITLVAVYSIEGSTIQSKMIANSLFSTLTYQECRNEQESNIRFYNADGGAQLETLTNLKDSFELDEDGNPMLDQDGNKLPSSLTVSGDNVFTKQYNINPAKSDMSYSWSYVKEDNKFLGGSDKDSESIVTTYIFQNDCTSTFRFSTNNQSLAVAVEMLAPPSNP